MTDNSVEALRLLKAVLPLAERAGDSVNCDAPCTRHCETCWTALIRKVTPRISKFLSNIEVEDERIEKLRLTIWEIRKSREALGELITDPVDYDDQISLTTASEALKLDNVINALQVLWASQAGKERS